MGTLNAVMVEGFLVKDPVLTHTGEGLAYCRFSIGHNQQYKIRKEDKEEVSFFDVKAWGQNAEFCGKYMRKGSGVRVIGLLKQERWTDKEEKKHNRVIVYARNVEFMQTSRQATMPENSRDPQRERELSVVV